MLLEFRKLVVVIETKLLFCFFHNGTTVDSFGSESPGPVWALVSLLSSTFNLVLEPWSLESRLISSESHTLDRQSLPAQSPKRIGSWGKRVIWSGLPLLGAVMTGSGYHKDRYRSRNTSGAQEAIRTHEHNFVAFAARQTQSDLEAFFHSPFQSGLRGRT
ncbi:hypothetical protein M413DRAFT_233054 [Hebeloma cylindrosporum]|uniref:Uncharacterized protein n=1 Tax=Hebeloma cylindrosporum TaxID=76867 RepID=A0A0C2YFI3_HEBCY|nr:hypothetical protein M413DRAFT_233054 [Hebeloma cylindrosporum h7]